MIERLFAMKIYLVMVVVKVRVQSFRFVENDAKGLNQS